MIPNDLLFEPALAIAIIEQSQLKIGVCEDPPGSNRSSDIDEWAREFGSPLGSPWCALKEGHCRKKAGAWIPSHDVGSCDEWYLQAEQAGLLAKTPVPGASVLYTNWKRVETGRYAGRWDVVHIGTVLRVKPVLMSIEGNTVLGKYDRDGFVQALKAVDVERVLGYVLPAATGRQA